MEHRLPQRRHRDSVVPQAIGASDVDRLNALGVRVRLVKGAYREPREVAFQQKSEVDAAFVELMRVLLQRRHLSGHRDARSRDDRRRRRPSRNNRGSSKDKFEFQMLYGIRRDLQASLSAEGYPFRVYVPFGTEWFPYFMRRLGERPGQRRLRGAEHCSRRTEVPAVRRAVARRLLTEPPIRARVAASTSRHICTSSTFTYSSWLCRPAPPGPKSTDGMPAPARIAASVQNDMPIGLGRQAGRVRARAPNRRGEAHATASSR